ncbi:MAG TPA: helix-turn-helix domain-containing protein [Streptosporangiaceae bacterium]|nr:helix-turn-helix domain-containing protein [Streptosporangiaceae bacterium]
MSIGEALAAGRREAGLTITQVSQRTCIRETIVRGIERGDYSACGGDFYARGHIRSIARAVGLDPEELIREYDATQAPPQPITAADVFEPFTPVKLRERRRPKWSLVLLAGLVVVLGIVGFRYFGHRHHGTPTAGSTTHHSHSPAVTTTPVAQTPPKHVELTLIARTGGLTWVRLTGSSGRLIFEGDFGPSVGIWKKTWTQASAPVTVEFGNPGGAVLYLNGHRQHYETTNPIKLTCTTAVCAP